MTIYQYNTHRDLIEEAQFAFLITTDETTQTIFRPGNARLIKRYPESPTKFIKFTYTTP